MKLLFDQQLSFRLVYLLADLHPDSAHVRLLDFADAGDAVIWEFALGHGFTIVSKGTDFYYFSIRFGPPPKVIWLRLGNCTTAEIETVLCDHHDTLRAFEDDLPSSCVSVP